MGNTLYIGIDPSMKATGMCTSVLSPDITFQATAFYYFLDELMALIGDFENIVATVEMPPKTDGNRKTGKGNTRVVRAIATQMIADLKEYFPLRGLDKVKSRIIYPVEPRIWRMWSYGNGNMTTEQAKAAACKLTGIEDHNIAEAAILCKLGEYWSGYNIKSADLPKYSPQIGILQWLKEQFESEVE